MKAQLTPLECERLSWWLNRHKDAEVIVMDQESGLPVRAEYRTLSGGLFPVAYLFPSDEGVNL